MLFRVFVAWAVGVLLLCAPADAVTLNGVEFQASDSAGVYPWETQLGNNAFIVGDGIEARIYAANATTIVCGFTFDFDGSGSLRVDGFKTRGLTFCQNGSDPFRFTAKFTSDERIVGFDLISILGHLSDFDQDNLKFTNDTLSIFGGDWGSGFASADSGFEARISAVPLPAGSSLLLSCIALLVSFSYLGKNRIRTLFASN
jgi:hypothetical protein